MLVDPATGLPYKASGGGGGGSGFADLLYTDSTGQQFFYQDNGSALVSYKVQNGAYVPYTPVGTVTPHSADNIVVNQPTASALNATVVGTGTLAVQNTAAVVGGNSLAVKVDGSATTQPISGSVSVSNLPATQPISAASLPLPTGAATSALQTTGNTSLSSIATQMTNGTQKTVLTDGANNISDLQFGSNWGLAVASSGGIFISSAYNQVIASLAAGATSPTTAGWENTLSAPAISILVYTSQVATLNILTGIDSSGTYSATTPIALSVGLNQFSFPANGNTYEFTVTNNSASTATVNLNVYYGTINAAGQLPRQFSGSVAIASDQLGTSQVQVTPTVTSASAYTTGNVVGGLLTFANAVQSGPLSGVLESVTLAIKSTQTASFKLYLFSSAPSTTFTDKTAPAIGTGDAAKLLDVITLSGGDSGLGANTTLYVADNIGKSLVLAGTALYGVLTVIGTPTFTTTSDVVVTASILKD